VGEALAEWDDFSNLYIVLEFIGAFGGVKIPDFS
tara:strand:+ start:362 stop:463 length:102 start_codon:yes stop_codon:yes gene_type:complete